METKIIRLKFDGMGFCQNSGFDRAKLKLKDQPDGTVAHCMFYNGHSIFIKSDGKIRPITDEEIRRINDEHSKS